MKVIDLLNKLANGEVPLKIKYDEDIYTYNKYLRDYEYFETGEDKYYSFIEHKIFEINVLNEEVEIIEDTPKEDKKIEKIKDYRIFKTMGLDCEYHESKEPKNYSLEEKEIVDKLNEIIDKINGE